MRVRQRTYNFLRSIFACALLMLGFSTGYFLSTSSETKGAEKLANNILEKTNKIKVEDKEVEPQNVMASTREVASKNIEIYNEEEIKDLEIEYIDKYLVCGHDTSNTTNAYGISKSEFKKMLLEDVDKKGYKLASEEENKLTYVREHDQYCREHYIVKIENGIVVIYNIVNEGVCIKYKDTIIREETIRDSLKKDLKIGIRADSQDALYEILEEIES